MELTAENYYTVQSDVSYLSASQYKSFIGTPGRLGCEAAALAEISREYVRPETSSLLIGSYVDSFFSGTLDEFKEEHPEMFASRGPTKGELKSEYKLAESMIQRASSDELFMKYMQGDHQVIMTGEIEGVPVKCKIDSIDGVRITDLKTVKSINEAYYAKDLGQHMNFIEYWGYDLQLAIYQEIVRQNTGETLPCYIAAISKEKTESIPHPRIAVIEIPPLILDDKLTEVKQNIVRIQELKDGLYEPIRCGLCDYCADTEKLESPISMDQLLGEI